MPNDTGILAPEFKTGAIKLIMNYTLLFILINNWRHSHITEGLNSFDLSSYGVQRTVCNVRFQFDGVSLYLGKLFTG